MDVRSALASLLEDDEQGAAEITNEARQLLPRIADEPATIAGIEVHSHAPARGDSPPSSPSSHSSPRSTGAEHETSAGLDDGPGGGERQARQAVCTAVLAMVEAHPSMAPILNLANEVLHRLDEEDTTAIDATDAIAQRASPTAAVAEHARPRLADTDTTTVLTYSRSSTVLAALETHLASENDNIPEARDEPRMRIVTSEARPGGEGLRLARGLAKQPAEVHLTYDMHLPALVPEADLLLVGADAITQDTFVNKTGTRLLLEQARQAGTPILLLAASDKLWPPQLGVSSIQPQADLGVDVPDSVEVIAPLFERVPLALVDEIMTEAGPRSPEAMARQAEAIDVHPGLLESVS